MDTESVGDQLQYYGDDDKLLARIIQTIARLPEEIAQFAIDQCVFLSIGTLNIAMTFPGTVSLGRNRIAAFDESYNHLKLWENMWLILLEEDPRERMPGDIEKLGEELGLEDVQSIIAHEIGHALLAHDRLGESPEDCETQAAQLTKSWGFSGKGADAEYCNEYLH